MGNKTMRDDGSCDATFVSPAMNGHKHSCVGKHFQNNYHFCGDCKRWWYGTPKPKVRRVRPKRVKA